MTKKQRADLAEKQFSEARLKAEKNGLSLIKHGRYHYKLAFPDGSKVEIYPSTNRLIDPEGKVKDIHKSFDLMAIVNRACLSEHIKEHSIEAQESVEDVVRDSVKVGIVYQKRVEQDKRSENRLSIFGFLMCSIVFCITPTVAQFIADEMGYGWTVLYGVKVHAALFSSALAVMIISFVAAISFLLDRR